MLRIGPDCGPGFLEFWSPDCFCTWTVDQSEDANPDTTTYRTGPASKCGVYLQRGGSVRGQFWSDALTHIEEYNGFATRDPALPELRAKFYPGLSQRPKIQTKRFVMTGGPPNTVGFDSPPLLPGFPTRIAYPPHYTQTASVSSDSGITVDVIGPEQPVATIRQSVVLPGAGPAVPIPVSGWECVQFTGAGPAPANATIMWTEYIDVGS